MLEESRVHMCGQAMTHESQEALLYYYWSFDSDSTTTREQDRAYDGCIRDVIRTSPKGRPTGFRT